MSSKINLYSNTKREYVKGMFNSIHETYDLLNHMLSFGIDIYWRKKALKKLSLPSNGICLDLAAGTGDFGIEVHKRFGYPVIGYDLAKNSLTVFREKVKKRNFETADFLFVNGEAELLSVKDSTINLITIAFGIRNFYDSNKSLNEMFRILKPTGILLILEFSLPKNKLIRSGYQFYFQKILPLIGKLISNDRSAYEYLPSSVNLFDKEKDITSEMISAGFRDISVKSLTLGVVKLYKAVKR